MLQFLTQPETHYSIAEQCQMVIEAGCEWIQLRLPGVSDEEIRRLATELIPLCKETGTTLILEDRPELVRELGLHGIHVSHASGIDAVRLREDYGPEAIIGVEIHSAHQIPELQRADIDYVTLPVSMSDEQRTALCAEAAVGGDTLPIVFEGEYTLEDARRVILMGASGLCTGRCIMESADPVQYCRMFLASLKGS